MRDRISFLQIRDIRRHAVSCRIRGGGSGYLSKTVVYEAAEYEDALDLVVEIMTRSFRQHHMNDRANNVSPHMLKYTQYNGLFYPFGICSLEFA